MASLSAYEMTTKRIISKNHVLIGFALLLSWADPASAQRDVQVGPITAIPMSIWDEAEANDQFGKSVATGDFNGDGTDDMAVGVPNEDVGTLNAAGAVNVIYGQESSGLTISNNQVWKAGGGTNTPWYPVLAASDTQSGVGGQANALFGYALAAGDLNCDGFDDLAIGAPRHDTAIYYGNVKTDLGYVAVLYGSDTGLTEADAEILDQRTLDGTPEAGERFGHSLAIGNFDADFAWHPRQAGVLLECDDLAIGVPGDAAYKYSNTFPAPPPTRIVAGSVNVVHGSIIGLNLYDQYLRAAYSPLTKFGADPDGNEKFGWSLAAGNFDGDSFDDLAVGVPRMSSSYLGDLYSGMFFVNEHGRASLLFGGSGGLGADEYGNWVLPMDNSGQHDPRAYARFGSSVAFGDFDGDQRDELVIGSPNRKFTTPCSGGAQCVSHTASQAGAIAIVRGNVSRVVVSGIGEWHPSRYRLITQEDLSYVRGDSGASTSNPAYNYDYFGASLATGDFNGDGVDDLSIGATGDDRGGDNGAGTVTVLRGLGYFNPQLGLSHGDARLYDQDMSGVPESTNAYDRFGYALAAGDFDGNGTSDLAIGVPREDLTTYSVVPGPGTSNQISSTTTTNAGAVNVLYGANEGPWTGGSDLWTQDK